MTFFGYLYYYRDQFFYNTVYYYTYLEDCYNFYFKDNNKTPDRIEFNYLELLDNRFEHSTNKSSEGFCKLMYNNRLFISDCEKFDTRENYFNFLDNNSDWLFESLESCISKFLVVSMDLVVDDVNYNEYDLTHLFNCFYFPNNKIMIDQNTIRKYLKLIEYYYNDCFNIDNAKEIKAEFTVILLDSQMITSEILNFAINSNGELNI